MDGHNIRSLVDQLRSVEIRIGVYNTVDRAEFGGRRLIRLLHHADIMGWLGGPVLTGAGVNANREAFRTLYLGRRRGHTLLEYVRVNRLAVFLDHGEAEDARTLDRLQIDDRLARVVNFRFGDGATGENRLVLVLT